MRRLAVIVSALVFAAGLATTVAEAQARPAPRPAPQTRPATRPRARPVARPAAKPPAPPAGDPVDGSARPTERRRAGSQRVDTATAHEKCPGWPNCEEEGDNSPPEIFMSTSSVFTTSHPTVQVTYCDNHSVDYSTRSLSLNSSGVTGSFSWNYVSACGTYDISSSLTLTLGSNTLSAHICDNSSNCTTEYFNISYSPYVAPVISLAPYSPDVQDYGRCAVSCFAATYAQSTVPYFTLDSPRSVTLAYNGDRVDPKPFVHMDITRPTSDSTPTKYRLIIRKTGVSAAIQFVNGDTALYFQGGTGTFRIGGQFDAYGAGMTTTGMYPITISVASIYAGSVSEAATTSRVMVVYENSSPIARGWTVAGVQRAYVLGDGSLIITEGDGSATYFQKSGANFIRPTGDFTTVVATGGAIPWERLYPDSSRVGFNGSGRHVYTGDRFGNVVGFLYSGSNALWKVEDPTNSPLNVRLITLIYDANGLDSITDAFGRTTQVTVNGSRDLTAIRDPDTISTTFTYTSSRLATIRDRRRATTTLGYHALSGKIDTVTAHPVRIYGEGLVSPRTLLTPWQIASVPYASTYSTPFTAPRPDTVRATVVDPGGHRMRFTANAFGQALQASGELGDTVTATYNSAGQPTQVISRLGTNSSFVYDGSGFMTRSIAGIDTTNFRAGGWGMADSVWGSGTAQRLFINASDDGKVDSVRIGGVSGVHDTLQFKYHYTYDSRGRLVSARDNENPRHLLAQHWYDGAEGNVSRDSTPGSAVRAYTYDSYGRQNTVTLTGQPARGVVYDILNRPTQNSDGVNGTYTTFRYDSLVVAGSDTLWVNRITDPRGQDYRFVSNKLGWPIVNVDPGGRSDSTQYDRDGLVRRTVDRRYDAVVVAYDSLHRRLTRTGSSITPDTMSYSGDGRRVTISNANAREIILLDSHLRVYRDTMILTVTGGTKSFTQSFTLTPSGLRTAASIAASGLSFASRDYRWLGGAGILDSVRFGSGGWTDLGYRTDGQSAVTRFSGTDSIQRGYSEGHGLTSITAPSLSEDYAYDVLQRIVRAGQGSGAARVFRYDSLGHLRGTDFKSSNQTCGYYYQYGYACWGGTIDSTHAFSYDPVGNRLDHSGSYDTTGNRITAFNSCNYWTDSTNGNVRSSNCSGSPTYSWDGDGRLTGYTVNGTTVALAYDATGRLVRKSVDGTAQSYFLWDGDNLVAELGGTGATTRVAEYMHYPGGLDNLYATRVGDSTYFALTDALGNVRALTNGSASTRRRYVYDEWGQLESTSYDSLAASGVDRARFKGALWMGPELDVYYMRNRWYEPRTGRFLSEDPLGLDGGINKYAFAGADPVNGRDPLGLGPCYSYSYEVIITTVTSRGREITITSEIGTVSGTYCEGGSETGTAGTGRNGGGRRTGGAQGSPTLPSAQVIQRVNQMFTCEDRSSRHGGISVNGSISGGGGQAGGGAGVIIGGRAITFFATGASGFGNNTGPALSGFLWSGSRSSFMGSGTSVGGGFVVGGARTWSSSGSGGEVTLSPPGVPLVPTVHVTRTGTVPLLTLCI